MRKHLAKILLFLVIVALLDVATGLVFSRLSHMARGGDTARNEYICNGTSEDVLVFGSSRAIHHYNPAIISQLTGMTCYNCGQDGNGAILNYGRYHLIAQRYQPKVIIYDLMPEYDILTGEDNHKFLGWLRPYYDRDGIADIFKRVDPKEKFKMMSQMYRYNSRFIQMLTDCIHPMQDDAVNGFRPLEVEMDTMRIGERPPASSVDSLKVFYISKMLDEASRRGTRLVMVVSPYWSGMDTTICQPVKELCQSRGIPFLDYSNDPKYLHNNTYFADGVHLNARGADEFTRDITEKIKTMLEK